MIGLIRSAFEADLLQQMGIRLNCSVIARLEQLLLETLINAFVALVVSLDFAGQVFLHPLSPSRKARIGVVPHLFC
ncbi:MAG TPA: hypothetical protein VFH22_00700 [Rhodocyclaceae bacterium]|nr:hypothetical protein [Rhodocyclaceae bacterium]